MQHGLNGSSGRDGLNCWSSWYDSSGWVGAAKGFLWWEVTARRDSRMQPTPLAATRSSRFWHLEAARKHSRSTVAARLMRSPLRGDIKAVPLVAI
jgi:hypothetical protein